MENDKKELHSIIESLSNHKQVTYLLGFIKCFLKIRS